MIVGHEKPVLDEGLLKHHGVKGMKWGVHKKEELVGRSSGSKDTPAKSPSTAGYKTVKFKKPTPKEAQASIRKREETFLEKANPSEAGQPVKKGLSPGQKKALFIGAGALAAAAIIGGAAYAHHKGYLGGFRADQRKTANALTDQGRKYLSDLDNAKRKSWDSLDSFIQPSSYDRKEFTLPAGHTFHRISKAQEHSFRGATYATHSTEDFNRYLGNGFGNMVRFGEELHHVSWTSKADVKVPDLNTVLDTLKSVMSSNSSTVSNEEVLRSYTSMTGGHWESNDAKKLFKALTSKGYGAIVDEMDAGVHSDSPIILFAHDLMNRKQNSVSPFNMKDYLNARKSLTPLKHPKL